jgi:hypothetical protein
MHPNTESVPALAIALQLAGADPPAPTVIAYVPIPNS